MEFVGKTLRLHPSHPDAELNIAWDLKDRVAEMYREYKHMDGLVTELIESVAKKMESR